MVTEAPASVTGTGPLKVAIWLPPSSVSVRLTVPLPLPPVFLATIWTGQPWAVVHLSGMDELTRWNFAVPVTPWLDAVGAGVGVLTGVEDGCVVGAVVGWCAGGFAAACGFPELLPTPSRWPMPNPTRNRP